MLTRREKQCMEYLCRGYSNKDIAKELNVSLQTVKNHIVHIYHKLGISDQEGNLRIKAIQIWEGKFDDSDNQSNSDRVGNFLYCVDSSSLHEVISDIVERRMMNIGMLWFDNDSQSDLDQKINRAAAYYNQKYGKQPDLCYVHPSMKPGDYKQNGIEVKTTKQVLPNHFWIGCSQ